MTPPERIEEAKRRYAARGLTTVTGFDRPRMLAIIREQRRRHAHVPAYAAIDGAATMLRRLMREDNNLHLDVAAASDALLSVTSLISTLVAEGMHPTAVLSVMGYLADDLAKEAGR